MEQARTWVPRAVALIGFALYALAAPPGPYWLDSAELSASGVGLGVAHPTGFPLHAALVQLASLVPIGELAFRVNLLSAACAALAILWVARLVCEVCRGDAAALVGAVAAGAALGLSLTFFRQATVAEVYAPNAALVAAALLLVHRVASGGGARDGLTLAVVCGLGLAMHVTFVFVGAPVVVLLAVRLYRGARWVLIAPALVAVVALGAYAYLPVRAAVAPASITWTDADRADSLAEHVTGGRVRAAYAGDIGAVEPVRWTVSAARVATATGEQLVFVCLGALVGAVLLLGQKRGRWIGGALVFVAVADAAYAVWINPMGQGELQNGAVLALALCALAGAGVALFARLFGRAAPFGGAVAAVVMIAPPALITWSSDAWAASDGDLPRALAEAALDDTAAGGVAVVESDSMAALTTWLIAIEGARPDLELRVRQRDRAPLPDDRAVAWELGAIAPPADRALVVGAPLSQLAPAGQGGGGDVAAAARGLAAVFDHPSWRDPAARVQLAHQLNLLGRVAFGRGQLALAAGLYDAAIAAAPRFARGLINRGAVAAAMGDLELAYRLTERGLAEEPNHRVGLVNLARFAVNLGRDDRVRRAVDRLRALAPDDASGLALLGLLEARAGNLEHAAELAERALALDPANRDALELSRQLR